MMMMMIVVRALTLFRPHTLQGALGITFFGPYNDIMRQAFLLSLFYRGTERFSHLPKSHRWQVVELKFASRLSSYVRIFDLSQDTIACV